MEIIQEQHTKTPEVIKQVLMQLIEQNGFHAAVKWNGFELEGTSHGITLKGKIFDHELRLEITGWFEKFAAQQIRQSWQELVVQGMV
jgi:hypothetical protein